MPHIYLDMSFSYIFIVQGFGCPLQQRPSIGQTTLQRPTSQPTTVQNNVNLMLLTSLKGKLEERVIPALRSRTRNRPGVKKGGVSCVRNGPGVVSETGGYLYSECLHLNSGWRFLALQYSLFSAYYSAPPCA